MVGRGRGKAKKLTQDDPVSGNEEPLPTYKRIIFTGVYNKSGKIAEAKESLSVGDEDILPLSEDPLSYAFGKESRGRVRGIGNISSTQVMSSALARKKLIESKGQTSKVESRLGNLEDQMHLLINIVKGNVEASNHPSGNASGSGSQYLAPLFSTPGAPQFLDSANVVHNKKCELLDFDFETIATGTVCRDSTSNLIHSKPLPTTYEKVVVDKILCPDQRTAKINHYLAEFFSDIGSGGFVAHPKRLLLNLSIVSIRLTWLL